MNMAMTGQLSTVSSPIYGMLKRPSMVDFPGRLAAVMFTSGCNFTCGFCHNAALLAKPQNRMSWEYLEQRCRSFREQWVNGVVITGGEPTLWPDELIELITFLKSFGFAVKLDSNGSRPEVLEAVLPEVDYVAMDVKCGLDMYPRLTSFHRPDLIEKSIELIKSKAIDYEFRTTVIEPFHTIDEMLAISDLLEGSKRYVIQPFIPRDNLIDEELRVTPRTSPDYLLSIKEAIADRFECFVVRGA